MPQFKWHGVTLTGSVQRGVTCALSIEQLDEQLIRRGIAPLSITERRHWFIHKKSISYAQQVALFNQLSVLLYAGIRVPEAFMLVAQHSDHVFMQEYVYYLGSTLQRGASLGDALHDRKSLFSPMVVALLSVGYESGQLAKAIEAVAKYLETMHYFYGKMRAALLMPLITAVFVVVLIVGIFVFLVPYLSSLFASFNTKLPATTQTILRVSTALRSWYSVVIIGACIVGLMSTWQLLKRSVRLKLWWDTFIVHIPFVGLMYGEWQLMTYIRALTCLLEGGMTVHQALGVVHRMTGCSLLSADAAFIADAVGGGASLSSAFAATTSGIFKPDLIAMVLVGEESNKMMDLLNTIAQTYHERLAARLHKIAALMQPMVVVMLGLVVMVLIVAVYMPIMQMAHCV
jgi:general secretion pathway protein F